MQVPDVEGVAGHNGPESCGVSREADGEALTGEHTGWVLSREKLGTGNADAVEKSGRQHGTRRIGESWAGPAWSETPCTRGSHLHGSREILWLAVAGCPPRRSASERPQAVSR